MRTPLPIRWRLTITYFALTSLWLLIVVVAVYTGLRFILNDNFREALAKQSEIAGSVIVSGPDGLTIDPAAQTALTDEEHFVRLFDQNGVLLIDTSAAAGIIPLDPITVQRALTGGPTTTTVDAAEGAMAIATEPFEVNEHVAGVVQVGLSRSDSDDVLRSVVFLLLGASLVGLGLAGIGAYVVAGRALAPVSAITELAAQTRATDLSTRIELDLPDDELGRLADTFNAMMDRIEMSFDQQRRFTGDAAHELRTPIAAMRAEIDLALGKERPISEYQNALSRLDGDLDRVSRLLAALLVLARADGGRLPIEAAPFELSEMVGTVIATYQTTADERGIHLENTATSATAVADEALMTQVFANLIANALRACQTGDTVSVGCATHDGLVHAWVEDTGEGIAAEHLEHVFDRFFRIDAARDRSRGGAGLGLSICREIITSHGGEISIESEVGKGTRVEFTLPSGES